MNNNEMIKRLKDLREQTEDRYETLREYIWHEQNESLRQIDYLILELEGENEEMLETLNKEEKDKWIGDVIKPHGIRGNIRGF